MDHWLLNRNCLILCFHWFHFFCWQEIWLSIVLVWNQWVKVGEKESWSSSNNNKSGWSKQWTNISTNDSINNQNLQCKIISNPSIDVESQQPIFPYKAKQKPSALHFQLYIILNRSTHSYILELFDIQIHSWYLLVFTHRVYRLFYQFK